jgi:hypothetical protein
VARRVLERRGGEKEDDKGGFYKENRIWFGVAIFSFCDIFLRFLTVWEKIFSKTG